MWVFDVLKPRLRGFLAERVLGPPFTAGCAARIGGQVLGPVALARLLGAAIQNPP